MSSARAFYTVGHSTRSIAAFVELLQRAAVTCVVDVRTVPRSRTNPQYDRDVLPAQLAPFGIDYEHLAALGGLRGRARTVAPELNGYWQNASFHNYADYAASDPAFRHGLDRLAELGRRRTCAVMCAEAVWWRCHRRIVADYLIQRGAVVYHLMGRDRIEPARQTDAAIGSGEDRLTYPAPRTQ